MSHLWHEALGIWLSGGWAMIFLAVNSFLLGWIGLSAKLGLMKGEHRRLSEAVCRRWIDAPEERSGSLGQLVDVAMEAESLGEMETLFEEFRHVEVGAYDRDLRMMQVSVSVSPLLGLLGTVTGMLTTFGALAIGTGGEKTMNMVAGGISEALITTETGLIIAFPGLLFLHHLQQEQDRYRGFIARVETMCAQMLYRRLPGARLPNAAGKTSDPGQTLPGISQGADSAIPAAGMGTAKE